MVKNVAIGKQKYVHKTSHNSKARESEERKIEMMKKLELKRLQNAVDRQRELMQNYLPAEFNKAKKQKIDPNYDLKGAARAAREFYEDPKMIRIPANQNIFELLPGNIYSHDEGKLLLDAMMRLGTSLHTLLSKTKESINVFEEMLELDIEDNISV